MSCASRRSGILSLLLASLLLVAHAQTVVAPEPDPKTIRIDYVYMGGNDCPPCVAWRALEFPKLKAMPEFGMIHFTYVVKTIQSPVPSAFWFPSEIRDLRNPIFEASKGRSGSSQNAILVNGKVVDYWHGARDADEIASKIRKLRAKHKKAALA